MRARRRLEADAIDAGRWFPELAGTMVFSCTELNDPAAIEELLAAVAGV